MPNPFDEYFAPLPAETEETKPLTEDQWMLADWDTTPRDLREDGQKSLGGFLKAELPHVSTSKAMKWMALESFKLKRRALAIEKGEHDHKTRVVMDALYAQAADGKVQAAKEWLDFYKPKADETPKSEAAAAPEPEAPPTVKDLTNEELEAMVNGQ